MMNETFVPPEPLPVDLVGLLKLVADPVATQQRYDRLKAAFEKARGAVVEAQRERAALEQERRQQHEFLTTQRAQADYAIASDRAALEKERAALSAQAQELTSDRAQLAVERKYVDEIKAEASELGRSLEAVLADPNWFAMTGGTAHAA
jgi:hypothetical protein